MEKIEQILEENVRLKEVIKKLREKLSKLEDIIIQHDYENRFKPI